MKNRPQTNLVAVLLFLTLPAGAQLSLTTTFTSNNGQAGNMFDVIAINPVVIQGFDVNLDAGTWNLAIYARTGGGTHVGFQTNAAAWTLLASPTGVVSSGINVATPLNLSLGYVIAAGVTQGIYITCTAGAAINYTNGTAVGAIAAQNADMQITQGYGNSLPIFGSIFQPRTWNGTVRYSPGAGLFANFSGTPTSGNAPLAVAFTDQSFSSAPGGVSAWEWDFQNDGIPDSSAQNPSFTYTVPGVYSVRLTIQDGVNPASTFTRTNYITVNPDLLVINSTGVGDLFMSGPDDPPGTTEGLLLVSASIPPVLGSGALFGLTFDGLVMSILQTPAAACNLFHWTPQPGCWPNVNVVLGPGSVGFPSGTTFDAVMVQVVAGQLVVSNADRVVF